MIRLTRLNSRPLVVNSELIKFIENAPDTVITLVSDEKIVVRETAEEITDRIVAFRRRLIGLPLEASPAKGIGERGARSVAPEDPGTAGNITETGG